MSSVKRFWIGAAMLVAMIPSVGRAQTRRVAGIITVQGTTEPVPGATVQVVGTNLGGVADETGHFAISIPAGAQQLRIRRIGYAAKVVPVAAGDATVAISLMRDVLQLETQVITGAATTVSSLNSANAVAVVSSQRLNNVPAPTIDQALQGKIAGATISQNSGAPGGGTQVQIRGISSINASSSPLYVVDGVIVNNSAISNGLNAITGASGGNAASSQDQQVNRIADLNPQDIENIQILKGASAGAIYGSRGTNGVIIITTKRGRTGGKPQFNIIQRVGTFALSNQLGIRCFGSAVEVDAAGFDSTGFGAAANKCNNYQQQFYGEHQLAYETDASVSGGTAGGTSYFLSGLAKRDGGIQEQTGYRKQSLRANLGQELGSRLHIQGNTEIVHSLTERGISGNDNANVNPYTVFSGTPSFYDLRPTGSVYPTNPFFGTYGANPFQDAHYVKTPEDVYRLIGSLNGQLSIISGDRQSLDLSTTAGVDHYADASKLISPAFLYFEPADGLPGTLVDNQANVTNGNITASLAHRFSPAAKTFTATTSIGLRQERSNLQTNLQTGRNVPVGITDVDAAVQTFLAEYQQTTKLFSYYAQEEFLTLNERLLLTAAVNAERSSNNGDPNKYYAFPKFSASYRLPFLPPKTDEIKLRLAYGRAGNQPPFGAKNTNLINSFNDNIIGGIHSTNIGLANIAPEISSETEGGFDARFFGGRVGLSFTQFLKRVDNLILTNAALAPSTGYTSRVTQGAQLRNHGTEIEFDATPIQANNFSWVTRVTYSSVKGKFTKLDVPAYLTGSYFSERYGAVKVGRGYQVGQIVVYNGYDTTFANGKYVSRTRHECLCGSELPKFQMGFSNDINVGPVRLSALVDWRHGNKVANLTENYFDSNGTSADTTAQNTRNTLYGKGYGVYLQDGSFVKLRELTASVGLPQSLAGRLFLGRASDVRLEVSGRNLLTKTRYQGLDPEVSNFGNQNLGRIQDVTPYPPSRSYFVSVNATF